MHQCNHVPVEIWNISIAPKVPSHKGPLFKSSKFAWDPGGASPRHVENSSSSSSGDLVRNTHSWALPRRTESETLGGAPKSVSHEPSRRR